MSARRAPRSRRDDRGQAMLELIALLPVVFVLAGILLQLGAVVWAITDTTEAARQGARASSMGDDGCGAARDALSGALTASSCTSGGGRITLIVPAPMFVDALGDVDIQRSASLPDLTDGGTP